MGRVSADRLLGIWKLRKAMQDRGTTKPSEAGRNLTSLLVDKLSELNGAEQIEIDTDSHANLVRFIRAATGEIIAEIAYDPSFNPAG